MKWPNLSVEVAILCALIGQVSASGCSDPPILEATDSTDDTSTDEADALPSPSEIHQAGLDAVGRLDLAEFDRRLSVLADDSFEGRDNLSPGGALARAFVATEMADIGLRPLLGDSFEQPFALGVNLLAVLPGTDPERADEFVLLSAHYDHLGRADVDGSACRGILDNIICNGAADNAAGVAAVLGIADQLAALETGLPRSVIVVFWDAEEDGLAGSRHFTESAPLVPLVDIVAMFSLDILGTDILPGIHADFALGMDYSDGLRQLIHNLNGELESQIYPVSLAFDGSSDGARSDHKSFQEAGVPVVFFGSGSNAAYHTPRDELSEVDSQSALSFMRLILMTTVDLATEAGRPTYVEGPVSHLDDGVALHELGQELLADPSAAGLSSAEISALETFMERLQAFIDEPPANDGEWAQYQLLVDLILAAVYASI